MRIRLALSVVVLAGTVIALAYFALRSESISKYAPKGVVADLAHKPVSGATVETKAVTAESLRSTTVSTRADGTFIAAQIDDPGVYDLTVSARGYCPTTKRVSVPARGWEPSHGLFVPLTPENRVRGCRPSVDIYSVAADGSDLRRVTTDDAGGEWYVSSSPDGKRIAYVSSKAGPRRSGFDLPYSWVDRLIVANADGTKPRSLGVIHLPTEFRAAPAWSPDGRRLAWTEGVRCNEVECAEMQVWTVDVETGVRRRIARNAIDPLWSPDGRLIAYTWTRLYWDIPSHGGHPDPYFVYRVQVTRSDGDGNPWLVARNAALRRWSPDGTQLEYVAYRQVGGWGELVRSRLDGSGRRVLERRARTVPVRSPDGTRRVSLGRTALVIGADDGSSRRRIELGPWGIRVHSPVWSADGSRVYFLVSPPGVVVCGRSC